MTKSNGGLRRRLDWDVRGLLAIGGLIAAFVIALVQIGVAAQAGRFVTIETVSKAAEIPTWLATMTGAIVGFYFGARGEVTQAKQVEQGLQLDEIHDLVNARLTEAMEKVEGQADAIAALRAELVAEKGKAPPATTGRA